jgi:hypothetical protein
MNRHGAAPKIEAAPAIKRSSNKGRRRDYQAFFAALRPAMRPKTTVAATEVPLPG